MKVINLSAWAGDGVDNPAGAVLDLDDAMAAERIAAGLAREATAAEVALWEERRGAFEAEIPPVIEEETARRQDETDRLAAQAASIAEADAPRAEAQAAIDAAKAAGEGQGAQAELIPADDPPPAPERQDRPERGRGGRRG